MCGISGILHKNSSVERPAAVGAELVKMLESMTHRGRDSSGLTVAGQRTGGDLIVRIWTEDQGRSDDVLARAEESVQQAGGVIVDRASRGDFLRLTVNYEGDVPKLAEALLDTGHVEIHSIGRASEVIKDVGTPVEMDGRHDIGGISGTHGIGHVRMATESRVDISHAHPFWAYPFPDVTVVHNGQLTNYHGLKRAYKDRGHHFQTENDSEIIAVYLADKLAEGAALERRAGELPRRPGRHLHVPGLHEGRHGLREGPVVGQAARDDGDGRRDRSRLRGGGAAAGVLRRDRQAGASAERGHDLVTVDAGSLTVRELNRKLKQLAAEGADVTVVNPGARHNTAVGLLQPCKITIEGSVGYYSASLMDGPEIAIHGNAGWALGENMMSGRIVLDKDAGASVASSIRGGEVFVGGNAGARAGISMKGGSLVIKGSSGFLTGFMMQKGRIIVCGDVGEAVGDSMYEGTIYVGGSIGSLGNDAVVEEMSEDELLDVWGTLDSFGVDERPMFKMSPGGGSTTWTRWSASRRPLFEEDSK